MPASEEQKIRQFYGRIFRLPSLHRFDLTDMQIGRFGFRQFPCRLEETEQRTGVGTLWLPCRYPVGTLWVPCGYPVFRFPSVPMPASEKQKIRQFYGRICRLRQIIASI